MTNHAKPENRLARILQSEAAQNGHRLSGDMAQAMASLGLQNLPAPGAVQPVQVDTVLIAQQTAASMGVGWPITVQLGAGMSAQGTMPDWSAERDRLLPAFNARHAEGESWTEDETAVFALVSLLADFQTREAAIRAAWNARHKATPDAPESADDALPDAPTEDRPPMRLLGDEPEASP